MKRGEAVTSPCKTVRDYFTVKYFSGISIWVAPM